MTLKIVATKEQRLEDQAGQLSGLVFTGDCLCCRCLIECGVEDLTDLVKKWIEDGDSYYSIVKCPNCYEDVLVLCHEMS